jgi:CPA2 family monovalent cation:H+ antiporter-2
MELFQPILTFLLAGLIGAFVAKLLRINAIVGYLLAGVVAGPHALGLVEGNGTTRLLAELGIAFLLFELGAQFSAQRLKDSRDDMLRTGVLQMLLCMAGLGALLMALGMPWVPALIAGTALSLSSTAVIASILTDAGRMNCPVGRTAIAVSVFQDICGIFLLIMATAIVLPASFGTVPSGETSLEMTLAMTAGKALIAAALAVLAGRFAVAPLFRLLASTRNDDVFFATALVLVLAAGGAAQWAGLSMTLGAFLAGVAIAESPYRYALKVELKSLRGLLVSLFFISVGLELNLTALLPLAGLVVGLALVMLVVKTALTLVATRLSGKSWPLSTQAAFLLAQSSEFTLVILALPVLANVGPPGLSEALVAATVLSLALAPLWAELGQRIARRVADAVRAQQQAKAAPPTQTVTSLAQGAAKALAAGKDQSKTRDSRPVVIVGMSPVSRLAVDALRVHGLPHIALEPDPEAFLKATEDGYDVLFGDAGDLRLIETLGGVNAQAVVIGKPRYEVSAALAPIMRERYPHLRRYVAVETRETLEQHVALGMRAFLTHTEPRGVELVSELLRSLGVADSQIAAWMRSIEPEHFLIEATTPKTAMAA